MESSPEFREVELSPAQLLDHRQRAEAAIARAKARATQQPDNGTKAV